MRDIASNSYLTKLLRKIENKQFSKLYTLNSNSTWPDKTLKCTIVNRTLTSLHLFENRLKIGRPFRLSNWAFLHIIFAELFAILDWKEANSAQTLSLQWSEIKHNCLIKICQILMPNLNLKIVYKTFKKKFLPLKSLTSPFSDFWS